MSVLTTWLFSIWDKERDWMLESQRPWHCNRCTSWTTKEPICKAVGLRGSYMCRQILMALHISGKSQIPMITFTNIYIMAYSLKCKPIQVTKTTTCWLCLIWKSKIWNASKSQTFGTLTRYSRNFGFWSILKFEFLDKG
jgi:hypothetical protein